MTSDLFLMISSGLVFVFVVADWWAVAMRRLVIEEVAKPFVMLALIAVVLGLDEPVDGIRLWVVVALVFGLLGDVFLLPRIDRFVFGLGSFLIGHLGYVVALSRLESRLELLIVGVAVGGIILATVGRRIIAGVQGTALLVPVALYILVIVVMVVAAFGSAQPIVIAGAVAFAASDAIIGLDRFVLTGQSHRIPIMVLYHLGQIGLVAGLMSA